ncbi:MAG: 16S rRNA (adenine(1518)-N(6)/adenine(1519)-N(6))-dimethyltransferase RsmA [Bacteroidia bacterium]
MHNVKPKKHLGQHFLKDKAAAERIVKMLEAEAEATVVEIGPGKGVLTDFLVPKYPGLRLVEIDDESVRYLKHYFGTKCPPIHETDILKWNIPEQVPKDSFFISNLPYNISSPVMFVFLEQREYVKEGVFMVQKEVAHRICSPPGSKQFGILSVLIGAYYDLTLGFNVPPGSFDPPPKVQSAVFRMRRKETAPDIEFALLKKVVKTAFNQRRKTLRNALKSLNVNWESHHDELLSRRAETLSVDEFVALAKDVERLAAE